MVVGALLALSVPPVLFLLSSRDQQTLWRPRITRRRVLLSRRDEGTF
ncbi:MAG: hypothetical protein U0R68_01340 [Candidatus Nanopelagicales bacterium]